MVEIIVVMAVFHPNPNFLRQQIASLARQNFTDFTLLCVNADRRSGRVIRQIMRDYDLSWQLLTPPKRLNAPDAFEHGLTHGVEQFPDTPLFALCDQDDIWHPDKLTIGRNVIRRKNVDMVHSDARLIDGQNAVIAPSLFVAENRQRRPSARDLLYRNTVTGMTCLMRRDLVECALPFPAQDGVHYYHDLWLALLARCRGGLHFSPKRLVDYRQHGQNTVGLVRQNAAKVPLKSRLKLWVGAYGLARYLAQSVLDRLGQTRGSRALIPFANSQSWGGAFGIDAMRHVLGGRWQRFRLASIFCAITLGRRIWAIYHALIPGYRQAQHHFDSRLFGLSPGVRPPEFQTAKAPKKVEKPAISWWTCFDGRVQTKLRPDFSAPIPHVNILVPTLNPNECFAGIATAIDLGLGLARRGIKVRLIATDLPIANLLATTSFIQSRAKGRETVKFHCAQTTPNLPSHKDDQFIATAWWSAHHAHALIIQNDYTHPKFHYLIQDYEPCFYPWGDEYAAARASYDFDFIPIFNSCPLADYFANQGYDWAKGAPLCFHPAVDLSHYKPNPQQRDTPRKIALYGRPEVARNLFHMGVQVLGHFIEHEALHKDQVDIVSIGMNHADIELPGGIKMRSMGKIPWDGYPDFLAGVDIGLSLMCSPHPSHPPLEMAAAGAHVVTNHFGPKDLSTISPLIHSAHMNVQDLARKMSHVWHLPPCENAPRHEIDLRQLGHPFEDMLDDIAPSFAPLQNSTIAAE